MNLKILKQAEALGLISKEFLANMAKQCCPTCGEPLTGQFRNAKSRKEFTISGMCQKCQDKVFGKD